MAKAKMGALVLYCGHKAVFVADIYKIGSANVVRASGPLDKHLLRDNKDVSIATHHISDFPTPGFWRPELGILVVPANQVKELKNEKTRK